MSNSNFEPQPGDSSGAEQDGPVVATASGRLRGFWRGHSAAFLGVPFAAAPVGELRFAPPAPVVSWDDIRDARHYGPTPQRRPFGPVTAIPEPSIPGEETLNVNVFTPAPGGREARLPVFVWIHGGGFYAGSPASPWYDGRAFNREGIVTVTVSYRLGFDGFGWIDDAPNNRAVLDLLAALRWVKKNVANFGGDPDQVTIGGQSAGGGLVLALMSTPSADDLFKAAIVHSGAPSTRTPELARELTLELAHSVGLEQNTLSSWRTVSETAILDHERGVENLSPQVDVSDKVHALARPLLDASEDAVTIAWMPVVDGELIVPFDRAAAAAANRDRPLLIGTTANEFVGFGADDTIDADLLADLEVVLRDGGVAQHHLNAFIAEIKRIGLPNLGGQIVTEAVFRLALARIVAARVDAGSAQTTWQFDFRHASALTGLASHCTDLPFAWDLLDAEGIAPVLGPAPPQPLADAMHNAWVRFITDGRCDWPSAAEHPGGAQVFESGGDFTADAYGFEADLVSASHSRH